MSPINRRGFLVAASAVPALGLAGCSAQSSGQPPSASDHPTLPNTAPDPTAEIFATQHIVPVLRDPSAAEALATARAWRAAGCSAIEMTTSTPDVFGAVKTLAQEGAYVGVGTMRSAAHVQQAAEAGARFVLSFATFPALISEALARGVTPIPGTMTPTEVFMSLQAPIIKVFPAVTVGIGYLEALQVVYPGIRTQVTGGVGATPSDSVAWIKAGATAVGVSGDACGRVSQIGAAKVTANVRAYLAEVASGLA